MVLAIHGRAMVPWLNVYPVIILFESRGCGHFCLFHPSPVGTESIEKGKNRVSMESAKTSPPAR